MEDLGAEVVQIDGNYDASVHVAARDATNFGWHIISDTSYEGYMEIPRHIMAGYTVMAAEIIDQLGGDSLPPHIFLQGGVGGLASAVAAYFWESLGSDCPHITIVEPNTAPCLLASARAGKPTAVPITEETMMAGLSCGEVSLLSWTILEQAADSFITSSDAQVPHMMRTLG